MKLLAKLGSSVVRETVLAAAMMAGLLALVGAGTASARPRVVIGCGGPAVVGGYYAPAPYWRAGYVAPRTRYRYYHRGLRHRYWDARLHGWRHR